MRSQFFKFIITGNILHLFQEKIPSLIIKEKEQVVLHEMATSTMRQLFENIIIEFNPLYDIFSRSLELK